MPALGGQIPDEADDESLLTTNTVTYYSHMLPDT